MIQHEFPGNRLLTIPLNRKKIESANFSGSIIISSLGQERCICTNMNIAHYNLQHNYIV